LRRIENKGLAIDRLELRTIARETAEEHYGEHREKPFFRGASSGSSRAGL